MTRFNLRLLLAPLTALSAALLLAVVGVLYADNLVGAAEARLAAQTRQLSQSRQRHANAGLEKDILQRFRETYDALGRIGFVGPEQRLNWVDGLREVNREARMFGIDYQIGQQEAYPGAAGLGVPELPMRQSIMRVRMPLLHEGDLMSFFRLLAARGNGVFTINACDLRRTERSPGIGAEPTLLAECELAWITVAEPEPPSK
jgi:hypothetical protein